MEYGALGKPELELVDETDVQALRMSAEHLLALFGEPTDAEFGVGSEASFYTQKTERYKLIGAEYEYEDHDQQIDIWHVPPNNEIYEPGLYIDVWTGVGSGQVGGKLVQFWRRTTYALCDNGEFSASDSYEQYDIETDKLVVARRPEYFPMAELLATSPNKRKQEIFKMQTAMGAGFTMYDYDQLARALSMCNLNTM